MTSMNIEHQSSLKAVLEDLPQRDPTASFGADIDGAHGVLLDPEASTDQKDAALRTWLHRNQPCLFGRLAAREALGSASSKGLAIDIVLIDAGDMALGDLHVAAKIQTARQAWKDRAARGQSSAFLILFNSVHLALALPSEKLASTCQRLAGLYLQEAGPVARNVVYTESLPLHDHNDGWALFKASTQLFYSGAHLMRNHDRRFPGGVAIVVNGPGHYARSLVCRSIEPDYPKAVEFTHTTAMRSIGNGGIGHPNKLGSSWHHSDGTQPSVYAATYQVDVLVQSDVVTDSEPRFQGHRDEDVWASMHLEYISTKATLPEDPDFGWFNGMQIEEPARYINPWLPRWAENTPEFNY